MKFDFFLLPFDEHNMNFKVIILDDEGVLHLMPLVIGLGHEHKWSEIEVDRSGGFVEYDIGVVIINNFI